MQGNDFQVYVDVQYQVIKKGGLLFILSFKKTCFRRKEIRTKTKTGNDFYCYSYELLQVKFPINDHYNENLLVRWFLSRIIDVAWQQFKRVGLEIIFNKIQVIRYKK